MTKILITGASGFLGSKLANIFSQDSTVIGTYDQHPTEGLTQLDVRDRDAVINLIKSERPDLVVHTVAMSDADECEKQKELAEQINVRGTENIADACRETGSKLIYISTNYVFDGKKGDYKETDVPNPINWYGKTKLMAEQAALSIPNSSVLRFDMLYGYNGRDKANSHFGKVLKNTPLKVNYDQLRQPLFVDDIGRVIKTINERGESGIFHLAGPDRTSKYDLCRRFEEIVRPGDVTKLIPVEAEKQFAVRPKNTTLDVGKAESLGIEFTSIDNALAEIKNKIETERNEIKAETSERKRHY